MSIKLFLLGPEKGGKTALAARFLHDSFSIEHDATMEETQTREQRIDGENAIIEIKEVGGIDDEVFAGLRKESVAKSDVVMLVYDMGDAGSFKAASKMGRELDRRGGKLMLVVVGNKADKGSKGVTEAEGRALAKELSGYYLESSAKDNKNVMEAFEEAVRLVRNGFKEQEEPAPPPPEEVEEEEPAPPPPPPPPAPAGSDGHKGWLTKTPRGMMGSAQKRFFKLEGTALSYHKDEKDVAIRTLNLVGASFIATNDKLTFKLDGPNLDPKKPGAVTLTCADSDQYEIWKQAIHAGIQRGQS